MNQSLPHLYRLANEAANQLAAAVECHPRDTGHWFTVLARAVHLIWCNRWQMEPAEAEMAELVSVGVGGATAADLTRDGVTALKELVHEFLGVTVLTSEGRERARALAAQWLGNAPVQSDRSSLDTAYQS